MSETVNIFGKSYRSYEMTHADKVTAWIHNAPEVDIHVGKFTLKYRYGYDRDWGAAWMCWSNPAWEDTPEEQYFEEVCNAMRTWHSEISFIDNLIDAMQKKPFNQGETK